MTTSDPIEETNASLAEMLAAEGIALEPSQVEQLGPISRVAMVVQ